MREAGTAMEMPERLDHPEGWIERAISALRDRIRNVESASRELTPREAAHVQKVKTALPHLERGLQILKYDPSS